MKPLVDWFRMQGWKPFAFQRETWRAYVRGESGLLHAPTGTGKTYAVWGGPLLEYLTERSSSRANDSTRKASGGGGGGSSSVESRADNSSGTNSAKCNTSGRVLWLTPLRALAADTAEALRAPLETLGIPWTVELRTGDTTQSVRARQRRQLPHALITTPESLSLLLSYMNGDEQFRSLRAIIVDEWHELIGSKRGVQTELCLAHLRRIAPRARTWGLSATLGNMEQAARTLLGLDHADAGKLIVGKKSKAITIETLKPESAERFPWAGHLGIKLLDQVALAIERAASTLVFTNTRSQTEIWFQSLLKHRPEWLGAIAIHHGSLDREVREEVERRLRAGALRAVVCTSSLDLGVDFTPVDQVIQIGSPKGVARMLQRAGRSGHQPGAISRIIGVPTHALELIEFAAARDSVKAHRFESRIPIDRPLDVLAQHLVTLGVGSGFRETDAHAEALSTQAFASLSDAEWKWIMEFVTRGGPALRAYPRYARLAQDENGIYRISTGEIARLHRMSIGTITSDASMAVRMVGSGIGPRGRGMTGGTRLGTVEESFLSRLRPGDRFVFAGRVVELVGVREMTAFVRKAKQRSGTVPRWMGGRSPLSTQLAQTIREKLEAAAEGEFTDDELKLVRPLLELQARWSHIPGRNELLVERSHYRTLFHTFIFPFAGRLAHDGLAALAAYRITRVRPCSISVSANDYGFEIATDFDLQLTEDDLRELLSTDRLIEDLLASLNASELARRRFRDIARVAGLLFPGFPGQGKSARQLQASSELFFEVFSEFDPENLLLDQARREVLDREMEIARLRSTLEQIENQTIILKETSHFTPLAFPLWAEQMRTQHVSSELWIDRVKRMANQLEETAARERRPRRARNRVEV